MKTSYLVILLLIVVSCQSTAQKGSIKEPKKEIEPAWTSKFRAFSIADLNKWKQTIYSDTKQTTLIGLTYDTSSMHCQFKITSKVPRSEFSDEDLYKSFPENMPYTDPEFVQIAENDTTFHEQIFHQFIFDVYVESKGTLRQHFLIYRTDEVSFYIELTYPIDKKGSTTAVIPQELIELDKNITLKTDK